LSVETLHFNAGHEVLLGDDTFIGYGTPERPGKGRIIATHPFAGTPGSPNPPPDRPECRGQVVTAVHSDGTYDLEFEVGSEDVAERVKPNRIFIVPPRAIMSAPAPERPSRKLPVVNQPFKAASQIF
jgi:hypothetical protein